MARETQSTDFINRETEGALSWTHLVVGSPTIEAVPEREFKTVAEMEQFMNEEITIVVHKSPDRNAPPRVPVGLNGQTVWLPRDVPIKIPRKFVGVLAQAQEADFQTLDDPNPNADEGKYVTRRNSQSHPFAVLRDPNPKGAAWLRRVLREG
jgi:hypothetical protein